MIVVNLFTPSTTILESKSIFEMKQSLIRKANQSPVLGTLLNLYWPRPNRSHSKLNRKPVPLLFYAMEYVFVKCQMGQICANSPAVEKNCTQRFAQKFSQLIEGIAERF